MTEPRALVRIHIRQVPALAGLAWIRRGFRAFLRQPGGFLGLFGMLLIALLALSLPMAVLTAAAQQFQVDPILAQLAGAVMLLPLLTLGFMTATESVMNDVRVRPMMFFAPLGPGRPRKAILQIALAYVALLVIAWFAGNGIDGHEAQKWFEAGLLLPQSTDAPPVPVPLSDRGTAVLALKIAIVALGSIPLWHAPALVLWGAQRPALALFSSIVALWRTRAAFIVFLLGWFAVVMSASLLMTLMSTVAPGIVLIVIWLMLQWALSSVFYVTLWFGFSDTFEIVPLPAAPAAGIPLDNPHA